MINFRLVAGTLALIALAPPTGLASSRPEFSMAQVLHYPFVTELAAAEHGDVIAWVCNLDGVRNVWIARGPSFAPRQTTQYHDDDGQENRSADQTYRKIGSLQSVVRIWAEVNPKRLSRR